MSPFGNRNRDENWDKFYSDPHMHFFNHHMPLTRLFFSPKVYLPNVTRRGGDVIVSQL